MTFFELKNVGKSYGSAQALSNVALNIKVGQIHALMGENGAGKSTLIKIIAGVTSADYLEFDLNGQPITLETPQDAERCGFRFIHQELNIIPQLSVAENILLGHSYPKKFWIGIDWAQINIKAQAALERLQLSHIQPKTKMASLSTGDQMLVKIASTLMTSDKINPCLYVLDEPTAALSDAESNKLFEVINQLKSDGASILYVSHRIDEVMKICDAITILRDGSHILTDNMSALSKQEIIQHMTGRVVKNAYPIRKTHIEEQSFLRCNNISTRHISGVNFDLKKGEILGVAGLANMGQNELLSALLGVDKLLTGEVFQQGKRADINSPATAWQEKIAYVPRERRKEGLMLHSSIVHNTTLPHLKKFANGFGVINQKTERDHSQKFTKEVDLKSAHLSQPTYQLSGGNQQKVVFARAIGDQPQLLLLDEPTRGVDVGAKFDIYSLIRILSQKGTSVVLTSSDLPELIAMCDRILIMRHGMQQTIVPTENLTASSLLELLNE